MDQSPRVLDNSVCRTAEEMDNPALPEVDLQAAIDLQAVVDMRRFLAMGQILPAGCQSMVCLDIHRHLMYRG